MAPGLNGSQTGTVPKNKSRTYESQSHRLTSEPFVQLPFLEWEHMSEGNKNSKNRSSTSRSEAEADLLRHELGRSRSSTMTSQNGNAEACSHDSFPVRVNAPDRKQVANKLSQIQSYVQQTAALMSTLKASDSGNNNFEANEEELTRRSKESKRKLETLQKRKQELLSLQDKAKKQLQEAQAEQSRLAARASSLNHELNESKVGDLNVQQLHQRLKAVQEIYNTRDQIVENLNENQRAKSRKAKRPEDDQTETSDTETDLQLVADKMEELDAMKAQLGQIQKIMSSISAMQNAILPSNAVSSVDSVTEPVNHNSQNSSFSEGEHNEEDGNNNLMKLEQAKTKLNHLTQLLEIVQSAQNTNGLSPTYLQLVSNLVGEETNSCTQTPSPTCSLKLTQRSGGEMAVQTMQAMTKELEETTAAMKEERDRLLAARQELQDIAKRLPLNKSEAESVSPEYDSESEPPCLKPATLNSDTRNSLNGLTEAEQSSNCNDSSPYMVRPVQSRSRQRGMWDSSSPGSNCTTQERRVKNDSLSRGYSSSRGNSRSLGRNAAHSSPSPSISGYHERPSALTESQQQLEMCGNLCDMMLAESLPRGVRPGDISLQEMFSQHRLLTRTVAQCSQLLWLQQKQIVELRNAIMLQCGPYFNQQLPITTNQPQLNVSTVGNPFLAGPSISNIRHIPPVTVQQHQNFLHPLYQNVKLNVGEMQNMQTPHQDFPDQCLQHANQTVQFSDGFGCDLRSGNFSRFNPSSSNINHNTHQNLSSGFNNRGLNGLNSLVPEDSGALNNQVPPGNRANNYWDNFRSYSRQNLLSNTKSNEDSEISRRCLTVTSQDRPPRDSASSSAYNNQSTAGTSQQPAFVHGNCETAISEQYLLPPSQNTRPNHNGQSSRSGSVEPQSQRNPGKNESRHQENDSRNLNSSAKNEGLASGRTRNPDGVSDIRSVRNDVTQGFRNTDNINTTRNFIQTIRDIDNNEETSHGNNKKRLERTRHRNEGLDNLNNRGYHNSSLWDNIYAEVSNFIRANESRPHFLLQLFRDLQLVTTDNLRQRTLVAIQETGTANNLTERSSNMSGINVNVVENRNNIRENRSNLNRNLAEDPDRVDQLFYNFRENQNTIRQNIGMNSHLGGNLENPNISNIRDLGNPRNNLENEGLRDLRTYFEANLCNFGHNSALENPNLSNIRENLTRRVPGMSDMENVQPKNVFLSIYDNTVEPRRGNQESSSGIEFGASYRNYHLSNETAENCENVRGRNGDFEVENNVEDVAGGRSHFEQEDRPASSRFPLMEGGDNFGRSRQFLGNGNDSGIDINFNSDERKRIFAEGDTNGNDDSVKVIKKEFSEDENSTGPISQSEWDRTGGREVCFNSSNRVGGASSFISVSDNSFLHCRTFQQSDNGDLAEADQSRNEETSGAESDSGFIYSQIDSGIRFSTERNVHLSENSYSAQTIPESERNFAEQKNCENDCNAEGACGGSLEGASNFKGKSTKANDNGDTVRKNETTENYFYQLNGSPSSENTFVQKSGVKHRKRADDTSDRESAVDLKKASSKNSTNKFRDNSFSQSKSNGNEDLNNRKPEMDSRASTSDGRSQGETRDSMFYGAFQLALEKSVEAEKGNTSPEADSDWECGSGLDQVPTRLSKRGSSRKSEDSNDSGS